MFGRYTLEIIAGRGGMGVVWRAHDDDLERTVALKFLPDAVAVDAEAVRDLKRETKRCLDLTHPHIVRVYDFMQDPASAAIAMEFVEGQTLARRKAEAPYGCLQVNDVAPLAGQLCAALDYAHFKAHIIHRDLKPANLLITRDGDLKVMDFGIARSLTETRTRLTNNAAGGTSGTLLYMSPQQLMGEKPCVADDIYALGATLYELLAGKPPFFRGDGYALMTQIREKAPPSMTRQREDLQVLVAEPIPKVWEDGILACLAKDPAARPRSAGELAVRLGIAVSPPLHPTGPLVSAPPPPPPPASARIEVAPRPSSKAPYVVGGVAIALVAVGFFFYSRKAAPPPELPVATHSEPAPVTRTAPPITNLPLRAEPRGGVIVRTEPAGAEVTVGALDHGPGPLTVKEVKLGKYPVRVRALGYEDWSGEVEVKENDFSEVTVPLVRSTGFLLVTSEPAGLEVEVTGRVTADGPQADGHEAFKTPHRVKLSTGSYKVVFHREGWPDQTRTSEVARGESAEVTAAFVTGKLLVTSEPRGAEVVSGGKVLGVTPLSVPDLQPGPQTVELRLKGYKSATVSGAVAARSEKRLFAELEKLRAPEEGRAVSLPDLKMDLKFIEAGTFVMGSPDSEPKHEKSEAPQTEVTLTEAFWIGKTEVTQQQYESLMGTNPSKFKRAGKDAPVENVTWTDAMEFCRKLTERERAAGRLPEGYAYTLPSEAEWEYACRAGTTTAYAGDVNAMAWHEDNRDESGKTTHTVALKKPNAWGLYDMHGNVAEWCADNYSDRLPGGSVTDYTGSVTNGRKVFRGGSWDHSPTECRSATRIRASANSRDDWLGFRVALRVSPNK